MGHRFRETLPRSSGLRGEPDSEIQHGSPAARRLRSAGISEGQRRLNRTSSLILGEKGKLFTSVKYLCCILYALFCVFLFYILSVFHAIIPGIKGNKSYPLKIGAIGTCELEEHGLSWPRDHLGSRFKRVLADGGFINRRRR